MNFKIQTILLLLFFTTVNAGSWMTTNDTTVNRKSHIKTAALVYCSACGDNISIMPYVGEHYDLAINPTSQPPIDSLRKYNPKIKIIRYATLNSFRSEDMSVIPTFASDRGFDDSLMYLWTTDTVYLIGSGVSPCLETIDTMYIGDTLSFCGWTVHRYAADFRHEETHAYLRYKAFQTINKDGISYDGLIEDEAHIYYGGNHMVFPFYSTAGNPEDKFTGGTSWEGVDGWGGYTWQQVSDSLKLLRVNRTLGTGWMKAFSDTMYVEEKMHLANITVAGRIASNRDEWHATEQFGMGVWLFETSASPIVYGWNSAVWQYMDSIIAWDTGYAVVWLTIFDGGYDETTVLDSLERCQLERLTFYYMAANPDRFYFMLSGNTGLHAANDYRPADTGWKWFEALDYDVGLPDSARYVDSSGTDGEGQSFNLYRRDYTRASDSRDVVMYYRPNYGGTLYGATTEIEIELDGNYQLLLADGTLGATTTTAVVRNCEGAIYVEVTEEGEGGGGFPDGWGRTAEIIIQSSKIAADLTDYPLLLTEVNLPSEMFDNGLVKADGGDIRFSSDAAGATQIAAEIVVYDTTGTNNCEIWVIISSLTSSVDPKIYVWYDSSSSNLLDRTDTYGSENVWGSEYKLVLHMSDILTSGDDDVLYDATSNGNNFTEAANSIAADRVVGKIGYAVDFDNDGNEWYDGGDIDITGVITLQMWISLKSNTFGTGGQAHLLSKWGSYLFRTYDKTNGAYMTIIDGASSYGGFYGNHDDLDTPKWLVGVYDGTNLYNYIDGISEDTVSHVGDIDLNNNIIYIGRYEGGGYSFDGWIDEMRIIEIARSEDWISTEYNNHFDPATFAIEQTPSSPLSNDGAKGIKIRGMKIRGI